MDVDVSLQPRASQKSKAWRKRSAGSRPGSSKNSVSSPAATPTHSPVPSPSITPTVSLHMFPRSDPQPGSSVILEADETTDDDVGQEIASTSGFLEYTGDEKIELIPKTISDLPEAVVAKITRQGLDISQITGQEFQYLFHIVHFLYKDMFGGKETETRPFKRIGHQKHVLTSQNKQYATSLIQQFDHKVPMKKIFPSLEFSSEGGFGQVFTGKMVVEKNKPKVKVAVKKVSHSTAVEIDSNISELFFLSSCKHPNIVKFISAYHVPADAKLKTKVDQLFYVMEWLEGGTLNQAAKSGAKFGDHHIAHIAHECLTAVDYLHSCHWIHRDLKSQNVMLSIDGQVKLVDFGLSCDMRRGRRTKMLGSPFWIPPEMIKFRPHSYPVDIWSLGVCLLEMYLVDPPLRKNPILCMYTIATQGLAHFIPEKASPLAKACLERFLVVDPDKRPTAKELLQDNWFKGRELGDGLSPILKQVFVMKNLSNMGI